MDKSKVIDLNIKNDYINKLDKIVEKLEDIDKVIFGSMIELSTSEKWKDWSENQKEGTVFTFEESMFENCPDKNVTELLDLRRKLNSTILELTQANNVYRK
ncbi:hypothetical protein [Christiangramia echinicola]|uniref:Uncharacterized protein n=1 Tax=Christiangramia echinicola TaxID=279359 RepID=A0A1H1LA24_9FLAO|nr:hypothetical protein [Christiangramia echinicola]SDR71378.1 hypothetical protein SAMN04488552_0658 [Christiangramia echinicola]